MKRRIMICWSLMFFVTFLCSCSSDLTLEDYSNEAVICAKKEITFQGGDFTILLPKSWTWKVEDYQDQKIILGMDAGSKEDLDGYLDIISIRKIKSWSKSENLKNEFEFLLNQSRKNLTGSMKIVESGKTNLLTKPAYFIHYKSDTGTYGEIENIEFIMESETNGVFYHLIAGASQTKDLEKNMAQMIHCVKTFQITSEETVKQKTTLKP